MTASDSKHVGHFRRKCVAVLSLLDIGTGFRLDIWRCNALKRMLQEQDAWNVADTGTLHFFYSSYDREDDTLQRVEQIVIETALACQLPIKCVGYSLAVGVGRRTAACAWCLISFRHCNCCAYCGWVMCRLDSTADGLHQHYCAVYVSPEWCMPDHRGRLSLHVCNQ